MYILPFIFCFSIFLFFSSFQFNCFLFPSQSNHNSCNSSYYSHFMFWIISFNNCNRTSQSIDQWTWKSLLNMMTYCWGGCWAFTLESLGNICKPSLSYPKNFLKKNSMLFLFIFLAFFFSFLYCFLWSVPIGFSWVPVPYLSNFFCFLCFLLPRWTTFIALNM